jgi:hypothetical protein
MSTQATSAVCASAFDLVHEEDDRIDVHVELAIPATGNAERDVFFWGVVTTDFWEGARVAETHKCTLDGPLDDIEALAIAVFERLAINLREYGTDMASAIYPSHDSLLAEVPPAVAARLNQSFRRRLGLVEAGTVTAVRIA